MELKELIKETDYYKLLGINEKAELAEITRAYKKLAKAYHPDRYATETTGKKEEISTLFTKITTAYNTLKDPVKRSDYNYERRLKLEYAKTLQKARDFKPIIKRPPPNKAGKGSPQPASKNSPAGKGSSKAAPGTFKAGGKGGFTFAFQPVDKAATPNQRANSSNVKEQKDSQAENLYNNALQKYKKGDLEAAILELQTAITIKPEIAKYHSVLGLIMEKKGWNSYALAEYKIALKHDPQDKIALEKLAKAQTGPLKEKENKPSPEKQSRTIGLVKLIKRFFQSLSKKVRIHISLED